MVCADPSPAILSQLPRDDRPIAVRASAEEVAGGRAALPAERYDAMLVKKVLHHVADVGAVISGLARLLRPGGRMLVVMLPLRITYPLFDVALAEFARHQPDPSGIADAMRAAGLDASLSHESFPLAFPCRAVPADGAQPLHVTAIGV